VIAFEILAVLSLWAILLAGVVDIAGRKEPRR